MDKSDARKVVLENNLIPKKISKEIINYINGNYKTINKKSLNFVKKKEIEQKKKEFLNIKSKLKFKEPRNLPIYLMIKKKYKDFDWSKINKHYDININTDDLGIKVSLASLLFGKINANKSFLEKKYAYKFKKKIDRKIQDDIKKFFDQSNIIYPDKKDFNLFIKCFETALKEKKIDIISPICPDYSVEYVAPNIYQFTFKKVNSGVGVIGKKILKNIKKIHDFFNKNKIKVNHTVAIGDFEALSEKILKKVNCTQKEFLEKNKKSQKKFKDICKVNVKTPMFTDLCGGLKNWKKINNKYYDKMIKNKKNIKHMDHNEIMEIGNSRKELYKRWFKNFKNEDIEEIIYRQGAEYASMGSIIKKKYHNPLTLGADHHKMSKFYKVSSNFPVLYIKNDY